MWEFLGCFRYWWSEDNFSFLILPRDELGFPRSMVVSGHSHFLHSSWLLYEHALRDTSRGCKAPWGLASELTQPDFSSILLIKVRPHVRRQWDRLQLWLVCRGEKETMVVSCVGDKLP